MNTHPWPLVLHRESRVWPAVRNALGPRSRGRWAVLLLLLLWEHSVRSTLFHNTALVAEGTVFRSRSLEIMLTDWGCMPIGQQLRPAPPQPPLSSLLLCVPLLCWVELPQPSRTQLAPEAWLLSRIWASLSQPEYSGLCQPSWWAFIEPMKWKSRTVFHATVNRKACRSGEVGGTCVEGTRLPVMTLSW